MVFAVSPGMVRLRRFGKADSAEQWRWITSGGDHAAQADLVIQSFEERDLALFIPFEKSLPESGQRVAAPKAAQAMQDLDGAVDLPEHRVSDRQLGRPLDQIHLKQSRQLGLCGKRLQRPGQLTVPGGRSPSGSIEFRERRID